MQDVTKASDRAAVARVLTSCSFGSGSKLSLSGHQHRHCGAGQEEAVTGEPGGSTLIQSLPPNFWLFSPLPFDLHAAPGRDIAQ